MLSFIEIDWTGYFLALLWTVIALMAVPMGIAAWVYRDKNPSRTGRLEWGIMVLLAVGALLTIWLDP